MGCMSELDIKLQEGTPLSIEERAFVRKHHPGMLKSFEALESKAETVYRASWETQHRAAMHRPRRGFESCIVDTLSAIQHYCTAHRRRYGESIAYDYVLREGVIDMVRGLRVLLSGETGRLDRGTVDGMLCGMLKSFGLEE